MCSIALRLLKLWHRVFVKGKHIHVGVSGTYFSKHIYISLAFQWFNTVVQMEKCSISTPDCHIYCFPWHLTNQNAGVCTKFCSTCICSSYQSCKCIPPSSSSSFLFSFCLGGWMLHVCERVEEGGGVAQPCGRPAGTILPIFWALYCLSPPLWHQPHQVWPLALSLCTILTRHINISWSAWSLFVKQFTHPARQSTAL